jgi:iron complex transport system ATP-binding protein
VSLLAALGLCAGYGARVALSGVDLALERGELVGLLGPNGGGKSTLLLCLSGVLAPSAGRVEAGGQDLSVLSHRERARRIACVPQRAEPAFGFTVGEMVRLGRYPHLTGWGGYGPRDVEAADRAMAEAGVAGLADRRAGELSGGEFQRVLLARALAQEAGVLLLDEAMASMDVAWRMAAFDLLQARCRAGLAVLTAVHDLNLAALYCPRLVFLKHGRVLADGPTAEVFTPALLSEVYETEILVAPHPATGAPQAHPMPGSGVARAAGGLA